MRAGRLAWVALALVHTGGVAAQESSRELNLPGVHVHLTLDAREFSAGEAPLLEWISRSASIVSAYYGRFPVSELAITVRAMDGSRVGGTTFGSPRALIRLRVGRDVTAKLLLDDWVLVHEMTHLALPDVGEEHAWLSEGLATYVEGIARAQAGNRSIEDVWAEDMRSMPRGLPQADDAGLDHTHTWGRTYWGGALFCLLADVEIHRRTNDAKALQDALRAILSASGGLASEWPVSRIFAVGDAAVGAPVLQELYARAKDTPMATDLPALWRELGIDAAGDSVRFRDDAPLAHIRIALTRPRPSAGHP
ncbi:MAG TPA: hypothetical protein VLW26_07585 [Steroidobacteraceae bacterium]|nr:hypothetical protein [Steroidobacteraceae bacterium]